MTLSIEEVEHIASLARLELSQEEKVQYQAQLSAILDFASRLSELATTGILPTFYVLPDPSILREDVPLPGLDIADLLRNAPKNEDRQFKVSLILGVE